MPCQRQLGPLIRAAGTLCLLTALSGCGIILPRELLLSHPCDGEGDARECHELLDGMAVVEGDVLVSETGNKGRSESSPEPLWPAGIVPFRIHPHLTNQERITSAIAELEERTAFRFVPRSHETDYVEFREVPSAFHCSSYLGWQTGAQWVNVGPRCSNGNLKHEILHLLGMIHEQSRFDRDDFVLIHPQAILRGFLAQFRKDSRRRPYQERFPYDYGSIMHYGPHAYAKGTSPTITRKDGSTHGLGQRVAYGAWDLRKADMLYAEEWAILAKSQPISVRAFFGDACALGSNGGVYCWRQQMAGEHLRPFPGVASGATAAGGGGAVLCFAKGNRIRCLPHREVWHQDDAMRSAVYRLQDLTEGIGEVGGLAVTEEVACAVAGNGVACWGYNADGIVTGSAANPEEGFAWLPGLEGTSQVAVSPQFACAVVGGALKCWGRLGPKAYGMREIVAPRVTSGYEHGVTSVAIDDSTTCVVKSGALSCWGSNYRGRLGIGSDITDSETPVTPIGMEKDVSKVVMGSSRVCAIRQGALYCWGGFNEFSATTPRVVSPFTSGVSDAVVGENICALQSGKLRCLQPNRILPNRPVELREKILLPAQNPG